jgi:hypothetical protein
MEPPDLEAQLPELLRRTVANMQLDTHLEQRTREVVQHRSAPQQRRPQLSAGILVALVAALALAGFVWLRPTAGSTSGTRPQLSGASTVTATSTATEAPTSTPVSAAAATDHGITIAIDTAYADASQTNVFVRFTSKVYQFSTKYQLSQYSGSIIESEVVDSEGHAYDPMAGSGGGDHAEENYTPLLPPLLSSPQSLTLVVHQLALTPNIGVGGVNGIGFTGLWQVPFIVTPITPDLQQLHVAPITHAGVTVQPLTLERFTGQHRFDTNNNEGAGARLILRISGLLTPAALQNAVMFDSASATGAVNAGAHLTLDEMVPSDTALLPGSVQGDTEEVEILYWVPLQINSSLVPLNIDRIRIGSPAMYATGPWSFDLAIG